MTTPRVSFRQRRGVGAGTSTRVQRMTRTSSIATSNTRRRLVGRRFGADEALQAATKRPPLSDDDVRRLYQAVGESTFRTSLGLADDVDIDALLNEPATLGVFNEAAPERAAALFGSVQEFMATVGPSGGRVNAEVRSEAIKEAISQATEERRRASRLTTGAALPSARRQGPGATRIRTEAGLVTGRFAVDPEADVKEAEENKSFFQKHFPFTSKAAVGILQAAQLRAPTVGGSAEINPLDPASAPLDVFAETVGETLAQAGKLAVFDTPGPGGTFGDIEAPTLFTEGFEAALEEFRDRPFVEQLALSLLDPFVTFGATKTLGRAVVGSLRGVSAETIESIPGVIAREQARASMRAGEGIVAGLPSKAELLRQVDPKDLPVFGFMRRAADPSSEIRRHAPGSVERINLEAHSNYVKASVAAEAEVEKIMAWVRSKGNLKKLFDVPTPGRDAAEPIARAVTHSADGVELPKSPFFGDVAEQPHLFRLTPEQEEFLGFVHKVFPQALTMLRSEGVEVAEFGKWSELFHFFPRKVIDPSTKKSSIALGGTRPIQKHRLHDQMKQAVFDQGGAYAGPEEAMASYLRAAYKAVADRRLRDALSKTARSQEVEKGLLRAKDAAGKLVTRQSRSIRDVGNMIRGFVPSDGTVRAMQRHFPELADRIDVVMRLKPTQITELISRVSDDTVKATKLSRSNLRAALARSVNAVDVADMTPIEVGQIRDVAGLKIKKLEEFVDDFGDDAPSVVSGAQFEVRLGRKASERWTATATFVDDETLNFDLVRNLADELETPSTAVFTQAEFRALGRQLAVEFPDAKFVQGLRLTGANTGRGRTELVPMKIFKRRVSPGTAAKEFADDPSAYSRMAKSLNLDARASARLVKDLTKQSEKLWTATRKAEFKALLTRMDELADLSKKKQSSISGRVTSRRTALRSPGPTEAFGPERTPLAAQIFDVAEATELDRLFGVHGTKVWKPIANLSKLLLQAKVTFDVGAPFIQGLPLMFRSPDKWAKATTAHYEELVKPGARARFIADNALDITEMIRHGGLLGSSEFTEAMSQGGWFANLSTSISNSNHVPEIAKPLVGAPIRGVSLAAGRFGNAFETFLDVGRIEMWKGLRPLAKSDRELAQLATFVNRFTGVTSSKALGVPLSQREFESAVPFFAPRYTRAILGLFNDAMRGGLRGDQARKSIAAVLGGATAIHIAGAKALNQDIRLDPSKPAEFMRWDIAGQRIGFGSKMLTYVKALGKVTKSALTSPDDFLGWNIFDADDMANNPVLQTLRNQSSILASNGIGIITGSDPIGRAVPGADDPIDLAKYLAQETLPFWLDAAVETGFEGGAVVGGAAEVTGGVSFPIPSFDRLNTLYEKYAVEDFGVSFEELQKGDFGGRAEKRAIQLAHEDVQALEDVRAAEQRGRSRQAENATVRDQFSTIRKTWLDNTAKAANAYLDLADGPGSPSKLRESVRLANVRSAGSRTQLERDHPDVLSSIEDYYADLAEEQPLLAAEQEFFDRITSDEVIDARTGRTDYVALDAVRADIDASYGSGTMDKINADQARGKLSMLEGDLHPVIASYFASFDLLRPYWEAHKTVLDEADWDVWVDYDALDEFTKESQRRVLDPRIRQMERVVEREREGIKRADPEIDMALLKFYRRRLSNRQNIVDLRNLHRKLVQNRPK